MNAKEQTPKIMVVNLQDIKFKMIYGEKIEIPLLIKKGELTAHYKLSYSLEGYPEAPAFPMGYSINLDKGAERSGNIHVNDVFEVGEEVILSFIQDKEFERERRFIELLCEANSLKTELNELEVVTHGFYPVMNREGYFIDGLKKLSVEITFKNQEGGSRYCTLEFTGKNFEQVKLHGIERPYIGFTQDLVQFVRKELRLVFLLETGESA